jgi:hypothetical protein
MEVVATLFFLFILAMLWGVWRWCYRWSKRMGIEYDPFIRPTLTINIILTVLLLLVIANVWINN